MLIDDFSKTNLTSCLGPTWIGVSDQVMGGNSEARIEKTIVKFRRCLRLTGDVRLENNGGFIQAALSLSTRDTVLDASMFSGIRITAYGNDEEYSMHLRTKDNTRPWQSYRSHFVAKPVWATIELPFKDFLPHRLETELNTKILRRIGVVAIGRPFSADLAISSLAFYN